MKRLALPAVAVALLVLATSGCAGPVTNPAEAPTAAPQYLDVDYTVDGESRSARVEILGVDCTVDDRNVMFGSTDESKPPQFTATLGSDGEADGIVGLRLDAELYVLGPFELTGDETQVEFTGGSGMVGRYEGESMPEAFIGDATITGTVACTHTVDLRR